MRFPRLIVVVLALAALAAAGVGANLYLLGLTGSSGEPVGRLSPRAVFPGSGATTPVPQPPVTTTGGDGRDTRQPDD